MQKKGKGNEAFRKPAVSLLHVRGITGIQEQKDPRPRSKMNYSFGRKNIIH